MGGAFFGIQKDQYIFQDKKHGKIKSDKYIRKIILSIICVKQSYPSLFLTQNGALSHSASKMIVALQQAVIETISWASCSPVWNNIECVSNSMKNNNQWCYPNPEVVAGRKISEPRLQEAVGDA